MTSNACVKNKEKEIANKNKAVARVEKELQKRRVCWRVENYKPSNSKEIVHVLKYTKWLEIDKSKSIVSAKYISIIKVKLQRFFVKPRMFYK